MMAAVRHVMKFFRYLLIPALIVAIALIAWRWNDFRGNPDPGPVSPVAWKGPPPSLKITDPAAVFQRAFHRAPGPGDEIVNAERHEWKDAEGLTKWQWFIEVKASPDLVKYLREDNAFGLIPVATAPLPDERPAWYGYDPGSVKVLKSPRGKMHLIFSSTNNTLHATDSGAGFQRGTRDPAQNGPTVASPAPGRLPTTSPPIPKP